MDFESMNLLLKRKPTKKSIELEVNKKYPLLKMMVLDTKYGPNIKIETPEFFCFIPNRYYQYLKESGVKKIQDMINQGRPIYILSMGAVSKTIPVVLNKQIQPYQDIYIHIIELNPLFQTDSLDTRMFYNMYKSSLSFAILTGNPLPPVCEFPLYISAGEINVNIMINKATIVLTPEQLMQIKEFHCLVFRDLLKVLKQFLMIDKRDNVEGMLIAPIQKDVVQIDFGVIESNKQLIDPKTEPKDTDKMNMVLTEENYLGKIVTPWYRPDDTTYMVMAICADLTAASEFPADDYGSYADYFNDKYRTRILKPMQPLLLVKALSKRLTCLKPRGHVSKRSRDKMYEEMEEHLIPELCIKQDFPSSLWLQARLLPSILHRLFTLLQCEELRKKIALECGLGMPDLRDGVKWEQLQLDHHLVNYDSEEPAKKSKRKELDDPDDTVELPKLELLQLVQDFNTKKLEKYYPWLEMDEPVDIERTLNVTLMDIQYYENFINQKVTIDERIKKNYKENKTDHLAITYNKNYVENPIELLKPKQTTKGPELADVFKALVTARGNDLVNLERSETLGDSFLKLSISLFITLRFPQYEEGRATALKGQIISNKNLYFLSVTKKLYGFIKNVDFAPTFEWKPPYFCVPSVLREKIESKELSCSSIFTFYFSNEEQLSGNLTEERERQIVETREPSEEDKHENTYDSLLAFFDLQKLPDKSVADCIEALLGVYFESCGFQGGLKLLEWLGIIPKPESIENLLQHVIPSPILNIRSTITNIDYFLPAWKEIEKRLGYHFNNRGFLLQALTHSSFTPNRITSCYQKLEFLGDAVLDFLITCHIYETCKDLNPGDLTDLRSALVNNITFAGFTVRCGFHKFLLYSNAHLEQLIDTFVQFQENNSYAINDEVLILLEENDLYLAEHIDVPKVLGDIFESLAGAIFLDSGMKLEVVWSVFYRIMWREIDAFKNNVPKNSIRLLYETIGAHPEFLKAVNVDSGGTMVPLDFMFKGARKRVYGFGDNKVVAKRAAAKIALRLLQK